MARERAPGTDAENRFFTEDFATPQIQSRLTRWHDRLLNPQGTVLLALAVMAAPVRRAVRFKPGEALRYA